MGIELTPLLSTHASQLLRAGLTDAGVEGPHAFIRGLDAEYDRTVLLDQWLRPLSPEEDLRYSVRVADQEFWILLERLPWDSGFFSRGMARLNAVVRVGAPPGLREDAGPAAMALDAVLA